MRYVLFFAALIVSGCAQFVENQYSRNVFTLSPYPTSSGCPAVACKKMDAMEAKGYEQVRRKEITWAQFVNGFYYERNKLFPNAVDTQDTLEYISYQRMLAEQMDSGKMKESQWVYLLQKKSNDQKNQRAMIESQRSAAGAAGRNNSQKCVTIQTGSVYHTDCN